MDYLEVSKTFDKGSPNISENNTNIHWFPVQLDALVAG